jgi:uncharacterized protein (TIGR02271 family)
MASYDSTSTTGAGGAMGGAHGGASHLGRLNDLDDYKVADGFPDPRGWDVKTEDGRTIGKVGDLVVDTQQMRVRYVDVELDRSLREMARDAATPGDQEAHTLLPIGAVQLDDERDDVRVSGYTLEQIAGLPRYTGQQITREYETSLRDGHRGRGVGAAVAVAGVGAAVAHAAGKVKDAVTGDHHSYEHDDYDDQRLYAPRRQQGLAGGVGGNVDVAGRQGEQRLTLAEEQLAVGKRETSAGEVELRKTVETERVQEQVQLRHDEVTVERRPVTDASQVSSQPTIGEDEIRIPVMEEQLVVQKRMVPREEIIVRKNRVVENQTIEDTVRRERVDIDDAQARAAGLVSGGATAAGNVGGVNAGGMNTGMNAGLAGRDAGMSGAQDRATNSGLLDRAADKLDDLKDRVDGNPASRPGPDATDRRI